MSEVALRIREGDVKVDCVGGGGGGLSVVVELLPPNMVLGGGDESEVMARGFAATRELRRRPRPGPKLSTDALGGLSGDTRP